jgi:hypothetical protein
VRAKAILLAAEGLYNSEIPHPLMVRFARMAVTGTSW